MHIRLLPADRRDLDLLQGILEGSPPLNGLVEEAVRQYVERKLDEPHVRAEYERRLKSSLQVIKARHG